MDKFIKKVISLSFIIMLVIGTYSIVRYNVDDDYRYSVDNPTYTYGVDSWIVELFKN